MAERLEGLEKIPGGYSGPLVWSDRSANRDRHDREIRSGDVVRVHGGEDERIDVTVACVSGRMITGKISSIANPLPANSTQSGVHKNTVVIIEEDEVFSVTMN